MKKASKEKEYNLTKKINRDIRDRNMLIVRLWLFVLVLTAISWVILKLIRKPLHIGWIFLFWIVTLFGLAALLYGGSIWLAGV